MKEQSLIDEFLNYLKFERHFSPHTAKCYAADLAQFCAFLIGDKEAAAGRQTFAGMTLNSGAAAAGGTIGGDAQATAVLSEPTVQQKLRAADTEKIKLFLGFLGTQSYSKSTIARKLATLRSFYKFCLRRGYVEAHPLATIRTPNKEKHLANFM